jgi:hypothetical protein
MSQLALFACDLVAVSLLVFGLYFPRHRRRDLVVAYLGVNVGVVAVAGSLSSGSVGAGLGLDTGPVWRSIGLMTLLLVVMFIGDHPRMLRGYQRQIIVLDTAITDQVALMARLEQILGATVHAVSVERVDLVNDVTIVDVRYSYRTGATTVGSRAAALLGVRR